MMRDYVVPLLVPNARRQTMHLAATSESSEGQFDHEEEKSYADLAASCRFFFLAVASQNNSCRTGAYHDELRLGQGS